MFPPFRMICVGSSGSGKTNMIVDLILNHMSIQKILICGIGGVGGYFGGRIASNISQMENAPYEKLGNSTWMNGKHHRTYWYNRLLTDDTIDRFQLGYFNGWNTIPVFESGQLVQIQKRKEPGANDC